MKIFVTGATGFIGLNLAKQLADNGGTVHALCYEPNLAGLLTHPNIRVFEGSILSPAALESAMRDCDQVYHLAGYARKWARDPGMFYRINVQGTLNVLEVARRLGVGRVVVTSTAGVFGPSQGGHPVTEETVRKVPFFFSYESSKFRAEYHIQEYVRRGMDVVIVNPSRVYGPGLLNESNTGTKVIRDYVEGRWHFIPGSGNQVGNYVFIDDVVKGHILAMENGKRGEKYILGGSNVTYQQFFDLLKEVSSKTFWMRRVPVWAIMWFGRLQMLFSRLIGRSPELPPYLVRKFTYNFQLSSEKAQRELGYRITPLRDGLQRTLDWLRNAGDPQRGEAGI